MSTMSKNYSVLLGSSLTNHPQCRIFPVRNFRTKKEIIQELKYYLQPVEFGRLLCYNGIRTSKTEEVPIWKLQREYHTLRCGRR